MTRCRTTRWTGAAEACFTSSLVRRMVREFTPPGQLRRWAATHIDHSSEKAMHSLLLSLMLLTLGLIPALGRPAPQSADGPIVLPPELARVLTDYEAYWKAGDAASLARLFTDDGFVLPPGQPLVRG